MHWVIAYDVRCNRRRARVARRLERVGLRVQKSVFVARLPCKELQRLIHELGALIDPQTDQVAAWLLPPKEHPSQPSAGAAQKPYFHDSLIW